MIASYDFPAVAFWPSFCFSEQLNLFAGTVLAGKLDYVSSARGAVLQSNSVRNKT
jgi:hypothetical protein